MVLLKKLPSGLLVGYRNGSMRSSMMRQFVSGYLTSFSKKQTVFHILAEEQLVRSIASGEKSPTKSFFD